MTSAPSILTFLPLLSLFLSLSFATLSLFPYFQHEHEHGPRPNPCQTPSANPRTHFELARRTLSDGQNSPCGSRRHFTFLTFF